MQLDTAHALALVVQMCSQQQDGVLQRGGEITVAHLYELFLGSVRRSYDRLLGDYKEMFQILVIVGEIIRTDMDLEQFQTYLLCHDL